MTVGLVTVGGRAIILSVKRGRHRNRAAEWEQERNRVGPYDLPQEGCFVPVTEVLPDVVKDLGIEEEVWQNELLAAWPDLVGKALAARTRPGRADHGTLVVFVSHSVWLNELSRYGKQQMLKKLQDRFGRQRVRSLRLQLDPEP